MGPLKWMLLSTKAVYFLLFCKMKSEQFQKAAKQREADPVRFGSLRNSSFHSLGLRLKFHFSSLLDHHHAKLQEFLPKLLDVTSDSCPEIKPPPVMRPLSSRDLCDRFIRAMELVNANAAAFKT